MRKNFAGVPAVTAIIILSTAYLAMNRAEAASEIEWQLLNPRGEVDLPPVSAPSARMADLAARKIALYWNGKPGGNHFWNQIEELLKERLPDTAIVRYRNGFDLGDDLAAKIAQETDGFLYGVGD